jgi:hypothetical protein
MNKNRNLTHAEYKNLITEFSKMNISSLLMEEVIASAILGAEIHAAATAAGGAKMTGLMGGLLGDAGIASAAAAGTPTTTAVTSIATKYAAGNTAVAQASANAMNAQLAANGVTTGTYAAGGDAVVTFQVAGPSSAGSTFAAGVGALSLLAGVTVLSYNVFKWIKDKGTFKQRLSKAIKLSGKGKQPLIRSAANANLKGKMPGGGTQILQGIKDNNPLGQSALLAIEYAIDVPKPGKDGIIGMPMMRNAAEVPAGASHKNPEMHKEHGDVLIELAKEGLIDQTLFARHYYENFIRPVNNKTKKLNAKLKELQGETSEREKSKVSDKVGASKSVDPKFAKYAGSDKLKNTLVNAFQKAVEEDGGTLILDKYDGLALNADFASYAKLYKKVKTDKDFNPEGGDMSPQFFVNVLKSVFSKKLQGAQEILDNEGKGDINEGLSRGSLYRRRYYGRY